MPARRVLALLALVLAGLAVASVVAAVLGSHVNGCVFDDGDAYCRMATGALAPPPFSRRILVPAAVSWLPAGWSLIARFQVLSLVGTCGTVLGGYLLTLRLIGRHQPAAVRQAGATVAASLVALSPHTFRLALSTPVLVDQVGVALGLSWCLLVTAEHRAALWLSPPVAVLLVITREAWALPLLAAAVVLYVLHRRALALVTVGASVAATVVVLAAPSQGQYSTTRASLHYAKLALTHPFGTLWALLFAVGLVPALALLVVGRWTPPRLASSIAVTLAAAHLIQASVGGADLSRLAFAAMPFAVAVMVARVALTDEVPVVLALAALAGGTLVLWQPLATVVPGDAGYRDFYYPPSDAALVCGIALVVVGAVLTVAYLARSAAHGRRGQMIRTGTARHGVGAVLPGRAGQDRDSLRKRRD